MPFDFSPFDAVLLDLDGTIYHEDHAVPGAADLIRRLRREGKKYACLTNSTSSPNRIRKRLSTMGIEIDAEHIYSAAASAADYVLEKYASLGRAPRVFNLATDGLHEMLDGKVEWVADGLSLRDPAACDVVICGAPNNLYATVERQRLALHLLRCGAALVVICADRIFPTVSAIEYGCGALGLMLSYASSVEAIYCGKPQIIFFHELCRRLNARAERCILIGDNLESDIRGGKNVGAKTGLVLSGITRIDHLDAVKPADRPDFIFQSVKELA